jgi:hypothetical protein
MKKDEFDKFLEAFAELLNETAEAKRKAEETLNRKKPIWIKFLFKIINPKERGKK